MGSVGFSILLGQLLSPDLGLGMASATWGLNFPQASSKNLPWCPQTVGCKAEGLLLRGEGSEGTNPSSPKVPYPPGTSSQWRPFLDKGRSWPCFTARLRVLLFCPKAGRGEEESPWGAVSLGRGRYGHSLTLGERGES